MHRFIFVVLAAFLVASCDRFPDNGIQIGGMLPFEDDCTVDPEADLRRPFGIWDVGAPTGGALQGYFVTPRFESYLISRATEIQAEQNNVQVTNLEITLQTPDGVRLNLGAGLPNPYRTQATTNLEVAEDDGFTTGATISIGIPIQYRDAVAQAVDGANFDQVIVVIQAVYHDGRVHADVGSVLLARHVMQRMPGCLPNRGGWNVFDRRRDRAARRLVSAGAGRLCVLHEPAASRPDSLAQGEKERRHKRHVLVPKDAEGVPPGRNG